MENSKIIIICIWYRPDKATIERWFDVAKRICPVIIIDNSAKGDSINDESLNLINNQQQISYVALGDNKGIGYAQNVGIDIAKAKHVEHIIFFDQDSIPSKDLVFGLLNDFCELEKQKSNIAAIGPRILNKDSGMYYNHITSGDCQFSEVETLISSGTLVNSKIFDIVGKMNQSLFIDLVDHEWCWRAKAKGYILFQSNIRDLPHKVGCQNFKLLGIPFIVSSPQRYYYKYRNFLWLLRDNNVPLKWKMTNFLRKTVELFIIPCVAHEKAQTTKNIVKGIISGLIKTYEKY